MHHINTFLLQAMIEMLQITIQHLIESILLGVEHKIFRSWLIDSFNISKGNIDVIDGKIVDTYHHLLKKTFKDSNVFWFPLPMELYFALPRGVPFTSNIL